MGLVMTKDTGPFVTLTGAGTTLILELRDTGAPIWRYWGPRLPKGTQPPSRLDDEQPLPPFSLDKNVPLTLFPTFGVGWYGAPALLAHREGRSFAQNFTRTHIEWVRADQAIIVTLFDDIAEIKIEISLDFDISSDTLTCQTRLTNLGVGLLDVNWLAAACLPLPGHASRTRYYAGRYGHEFQLCEDVLNRATWLRENRRGLTSHECVPAAIITLPDTTHHSGHAFGAQLSWSGNHVQRLDYHDAGHFYWQWGEWLTPGEVRLDQGQSIDTPDVIATFSAAGLNGVAQNFHAAIRARMTWPGGAMKPRPVHLNTWEGVYFDLKEEALVGMATGAAALGVERFVLDDGWFHGRRGDFAGLGDWWVDPDIFPNGLMPLAQHVIDLGMEFGLWIEPEMVNPNSDLFRAHPQWALQIDGRPLLTARNQLVLDLSNPDVFDYLFQRLRALLDNHPISYLKWDHNRDLTTAGTGGLPAYRKQIMAAYRLFGTIRDGWPDVEIEACAGGGGRIDTGILKHAHRIWTSDCLDGLSRVVIQRGFLQFFPPEIMGSHIGASPAHLTGRDQDLDFRAGVALGGHFGIELDPRSLSQAHQSKVRYWVDTYKSLRGKLHGGLVWQGDGVDGLSWTAQGSVHDFIVTFFQTHPSYARYPPRVRLPFVDAMATYQIVCVGPHQTTTTAATTLHQAWSQTPSNIHGAWLTHAGLPLPAMKAEMALAPRLTSG
jgi:alpha-galactosidase